MAKALTCSVSGCDGPCWNRGWCPKHYQRWRRLGTTELPAKEQPICAVEECERPHRRNGYCAMHSERVAKHGDPTRVDRIMGDDEARFLQYVDQSGPCWTWTGVRHRTRGYGRFYVGGRGGRYVQAHRWSYEHFVGPIPDGLEIDHLCAVTSCVNPAHLEAVTPDENKRRGPLPHMGVLKVR